MALRWRARGCHPDRSLTVHSMTSSDELYELVTTSDGTANTGAANTHNNPAITMLFQDIRFSPPS